jgi:hypothetical protein
VAGQDEPWLIRARAVRHKKTYVFGRVTRRVQHGGRDVSEWKHLAVLHAFEWKRYVRIRRKYVRGSGRFSQGSPRGEMISVDMRIDDEVNSHAAILGGAQIRLDVAHGIDHRSHGLAAAAKEVRDADWIMMQELVQNHGLALLLENS